VELVAERALCGCVFAFAEDVFYVVWQSKQITVPFKEEITKGKSISYTVVHKKHGTTLLPISSLIVDRFSKFLHQHTAENLQ